MLALSLLFNHVSHRFWFHEFLLSFLHVGLNFSLLWLEHKLLFILRILFLFGFWILVGQILITVDVVFWNYWFALGAQFHLRKFVVLVQLRYLMWRHTVLEKLGVFNLFLGSSLVPRWGHSQRRWRRVIGFHSWLLRRISLQNRRSYIPPLRAHLFVCGLAVDGAKFIRSADWMWLSSLSLQVIADY